MKVAELMSKHVATCRPEDGLNAAADIMWRMDCGCVPVVSGEVQGRVIGMITDRDCCMAAYTRGTSLSGIRVADAMSKDLHACRPETSVEEAEATMREAQVRRLAVVDDDGRLQGVVSLADLARDAAAQRDSRKRRRSEADVGDALAGICAPRRAAAPAGGV